MISSGTCRSQRMAMRLALVIFGFTGGSEPAIKAGGQRNSSPPHKSEPTEKPPAVSLGATTGLPHPFEVASSPLRIGQFTPWNFVLNSQKHYANPYRDVRVTAEAISPTGKTLQVSGFCDGPGRFIVRLAFTELGTWTVRTFADPPNAELVQERQVEIEKSSSSGFLKVVGIAPAESATPVGSQRFVYQDGSPFFHAGDTCYPLILLNRKEQLVPYLQHRAKQGFSHIRMQSCITHDPRGPEMWAWGGTREHPDFDRFNPQYFQHLDSVLTLMREMGMGADLIVLTGYGGPTTKPETWKEQHEKAWIEYVVNRCAAFDNIVYWTLCNEFETHGDGKYQLDLPNDINWAIDRMACIHVADPYHHPVTTHPYMGYADYLKHFGNISELDFLMLQEHGNDEHPIEPGSKIKDGTGIGLEEELLESRRFGKPVVVGEYGYEWDGRTRRGANTSTALVRRHSWRIAMAGAHLSAGFRSTVWNFPEIQFDITNRGQHAADQVSTLIHFFKEKTLFHLLDPHMELTSRPNLCLRGPRELVIYAPSGGNVSVDLTNSPGEFQVEWLDTITGKFQTAEAIQGGNQFTLVAPCSEAVLHLNLSGSDS